MDKFKKKNIKQNVNFGLYVRLPDLGFGFFYGKVTILSTREQKKKIYNLLDGSSQSCEQTAIASSFSSNNSWLVTSNLDLANAFTSKP